VNLHAERHGRGEPVVFVHGSGWNSGMWYKQRDYLQSFMEIVLLDLPGHGQSPGDGCDSVEEYRDEVYRTIDRLDVRDCYLAGHSLGGAVAMSLALAYPDVLKGIVLIGTGARLRVLPQILQGIRKDKEKTIDTVVALAFSKAASPALRTHDRDETMKCRADVIYKDFSACDRFDIMDSVRTLRIPALIVCGTDDALTPPKYSHYLNRALENSRLILLEDSGHMVMMEKPEQVNEAIREFVHER
jgi:pimeloyl-ACP methyl ester carboxylesterase